MGKKYNRDIETGMIEKSKKVEAKKEEKQKEDSEGRKEDIEAEKR
ncbi:hypothetical protein QPK24_03220 [Paenibacillus polygoni]|uniref:Uncharacterized protein n=1 Tax=Paenibacillus polygoni TaxID=3050112 RepID=A0ABY8X5N3_9BACL|nr:hypothetical protein [Paenibacillus polygoni]WIV19767.1 hypothetical protein QPK24_03220 [Paenibacillus polygoni]